MAADLRPLSDKNRMIKFADDTYLYLIVPAECAATSEDELAHIQGCNLSLNRADEGNYFPSNSTPLPAACPGIDRVEQLTQWRRH